MQRNNGLDLFRLLAAFFVVCVHTEYGSIPRDYADYFKLTLRWAVPFFFMASGYFGRISNYLATNSLSEKDNHVIIKVLKKLLGIFLVSNLIYVPIVYLKHIYFNENFSFTIANLFTGIYGHLWFLGALVFGNIAIWYIGAISKQKWLVPLSVFLSVAYVFSSYDTLLGIKMNMKVFRYMSVIPFVMIGYWFRKLTISKKNMRLGLLLIFVGLLVNHVEATHFYHVQGSFRGLEILVGTIILASGIFIFSINLKIRESFFTVWGKKYALLIYVLHPMIMASQMNLMKILFPHFYQVLYWFNPVIAFTITIFIVYFMDNYIPGLYATLNVSPLHVRESS
ncbi:MAG: acyltransferase [Cyclobacteriaceae bacterium]